MTASAHFTAHADGTLTCRYGHVVPDGQLAEHLHPEPNRNTDVGRYSILGHRDPRPALVRRLTQEDPR